jgi:hypothetical protein
VIVGELSLWRVVSCCWLTLLCCLVDHALAVTCTDGIGVGLGLRLARMMLWHVLQWCCLCSKPSFFLFDTVSYSKEDKQKRRPQPILDLILARILPFPLNKSLQYTTQPTTALILTFPPPPHPCRRSSFLPAPPLPANKNAADHCLFLRMQNALYHTAFLLAFPPDQRPWSCICIPFQAFSRSSSFFLLMISQQRTLCAPVPLPPHLLVVGSCGRGAWLRSESRTYICTVPIR